MCTVCAPNRRGICLLFNNQTLALFLASGCHNLHKHMLILGIQDKKLMSFWSIPDARIHIGTREYYGRVTHTYGTCTYDSVNQVYVWCRATWCPYASDLYTTKGTSHSAATTHSSVLQQYTRRAATTHSSVLQQYTRQCCNKTLAVLQQHTRSAATIHSQRCNNTLVSAATTHSSALQQHTRQCCNNTLAELQQHTRRAATTHSSVLQQNTYTAATSMHMHTLTLTQSSQRKATVHRNTMGNQRKHPKTTEHSRFLMPDSCYVKTRKLGIDRHTTSNTSLCTTCVTGINV
jgi:hypothetical protein